MRGKITFLTAVLTLLIASHAFAGAWTQKKGGYYLKLSGGYLNTTQDINAAGDKVPKDGEGRLRDINFTGYLEYGISDELTLVATGPYKNMKDTRTFQTGTALERRWGFGDVEVRVRRLLWNRDFVASVAAGGKVPTWYEDDESTRVPLSTRKIDGDARLLLGFPFRVRSSRKPASSPPCVPALPVARKTWLGAAHCSSSSRAHST